MKTETELNQRITPEFIKWCVDKAEGFEYDSYNHSIFPLLLRRAVDGWNTKNKKYIIITDTFIYTTLDLHHSEERYDYNLYQPDTLTAVELAILDCLLDIWEAER